MVSSSLPGFIILIFTDGSKLTIRFFKFSGWIGDFESVNQELEIEVTRDIQAEAVFLPDVSDGISTDSSLRSFIEYVEALDELTDEEKKQAVTDLFLYGEL